MSLHIYPFIYHLNSTFPDYIPYYIPVSSDTTIIELTGLKEVEVKELVGRYLCMGNTDRGQITVSDELVQQVHPS